MKVVATDGANTYEDSIDGIGFDMHFSDVNDSMPHADGIPWTVNNAISEGWREQDGTRTFRSMDTVKHQDIAAFLRRIRNYTETGNVI